MKKNKLKKILLMAPFWFLGCGLAHTPEPTRKDISLDGVKFISEGIIDPYNSSTYLQNDYTLTQNSRLLVRFEKLSESASQVQIDDKHRVTMTVWTPKVDTTAKAVQTSLKFCPVTRNWMILATWASAIPGVGFSGDWQRPGGDYDETACVTAVLKDASNQTQWTFDVSQWFNDYLKARQGTNFGLILIATSNTQVFGEKSSSYSPRIQFSQQPPIIP